MPQCYGPPALYTFPTLYTFPRSTNLMPLNLLPNIPVLYTFCCSPRLILITDSVHNGAGQGEDLSPRPSPSPGLGTKFAPRPAPRVIPGPCY